MSLPRSSGADQGRRTHTFQIHDVRIIYIFYHFNNVIVKTNYFMQRLKLILKNAMQSILKYFFLNEYN